MINYHVPDLLSTLGGSFANIHNMSEINFDGFDASFFVSILIIVVYGINWPKKQMVSQRKRKA